jgi:hypothetical protein
MKDDRPEDELRHACLTPPLPSWSPTRWAVNLKTAGSMMTAANGQCLSQSSKSNIRRTGEEKTPSSNVAMIHEAGAMAVAKSHSRSPHRINTEGADGLIHNSLVLNASVSTEISGAPDPFNNPTFLAALRTSKTATLLNLPLIWDTIKALAQFIRNNDEGDPRLADTRGDSVAVLGHFARAFGRETSKTVLANVARAWRGDREGRSRWVQAPRQAPSAALPEREPGMTRALSAGLLVALLSAMPAAADHCPPGQFYRVRLNQCIGLNTRLASAYVHAPASRAATPGSGDRRARGETCRRAQDCHPVRLADAQ